MILGHGGVIDLFPKWTPLFFLPREMSQGHIDEFFEKFLRPRMPRKSQVKNIVLVVTL